MTEKVLCPWCGAEMEIKTVRHDVPGIIYARGAKKRECRWNAWTSCTNDDCGAEGPIVAELESEQEAIAAVRAAAMRRYTPPIKPMTLEEVWKQEDPVWVEGKNGALYIGDFYASMSAKNGWDVQTLGSAKPQLILEDDYGKNWRCWERKPTDEERSAAEWET